MSPRLPVAELACLFLLAACTAAPSVPAAPSVDVAGLDPCTFLDRADLSAAVDAEMPEGVRQPDLQGYHVCAWDDPEASTRVTVLVATTPVAAGTGEDRANQLPRNGIAEELHGVGEAAWFDYCPACPEGDASTLTVLKPPLEYTVSLLLPAPEGTKRIILESLGRSVIDRLGI